MHRILVVDDDPFVLEGIKRVARQEFHLVTAESATEAIEKLHDGSPFAAIISDLHLGRTSGVELLEFAREKHPATVRIMMTGYASSASVSDAVNKAAIDRFLEKPIAREDFLHCLRSCVGETRAETRHSPMPEQKSKAKVRNPSPIDPSRFDSELELYFQPRLGATTEQLVGAEALLRWNHPLRGQVKPDHFIPQLERSTKIVGLTEWVLTKACEARARWADQLGQALVVSVNITPSLFSMIGLAALVEQTLAFTQTEPSSLELEVTEGIALHPNNRVIATMNNIRNLGVRLSIDDFGTGFASVNYIRSLDVDCVKIDKSLINGISTDARDSAIVSAIHALSDSLGLKTVAEGIETKSQRDAAREIGIGEMQGFFFGEPMPEGKFLDWAQDHVSRRHHGSPKLSDFDNADFLASGDKSAGMHGWLELRSHSG